MGTSSESQRFVDVARSVDSTEVWCKSDLIKTVDQNVGRSKERWMRYPRVQSESRDIETGISVVEDLFEVVHSGKRLTDEARRNNGVIDEREVVHPAGSDLVVVGDRRAHGFSLRTRASEIAK